MKVRMKPTGQGWFKYVVQVKVWYGWNTLFRCYNTKEGFEFIEELRLISDVEFVKYV